MTYAFAIETVIRISRQADCLHTCRSSYWT